MPSVVFAMKPQHQGDVIITLRDGLPCFSYPQDKYIKELPYSFGYLSVSEAGPVGKGGWGLGIAASDRKGLLEPDSPETCIKYGSRHPGTKDTHHAKPLLMNTPYQVRISINSTSNIVSERNYSSDFCLTRDEKGNKIIVGAQYDTDADKWVCMKPSEKPRKGLWERLFGN
jgi:hypothetical protein